MRGIQVSNYVSGPRDLKVTELDDPTPNPDQYLICIHSCALNFFDLLQIRGRYQHQPPLPWISGCEFSGTVLETARTDNKFKKGDRVFGAAQGAYATLICATAAQLRSVPADWSFSEAAGLYLTAPTSYAGLVTRAGIKKGDWVLVHAAAGGVGLAAVQIARALGATVVATANGRHKLAVARQYGAHHLVDYSDTSWAEKVKSLTPDKRGVDIVYDPVGLVAKSMGCTAWNGRILVIGFAAGNIDKIATNRILLKNISVVGLHLGMYSTHEPAALEKIWDGLFDLVNTKRYKPTCYADKQYSGLEAVPAALEALGDRRTWGKVVVNVTPQHQSKI